MPTEGPRTPLAMEITRLRCMGRFTEAEELAAVLREIITTGGAAPVCFPERRQVTEQGVQPTEEAADATESTASTCARERIVALQDQLTKVRFESQRPTMSWNEPPSQYQDHEILAKPGGDVHETDYMHDSFSVDERARRVYEMAMAAVEQENTEPIVNPSYTDNFAPPPQHYEQEREERSARSVVLAKEFAGDIGHHIQTEPPTAREQNSADRQSRIDILRMQIRHIETRAGDLPDEHEPETSTRQRLRELADVHGLQATTNMLDQQGELVDPENLAPVPPPHQVSETCPAIYAPRAQERILELKRAQHEMALDPHHAIAYSDLDRRSH